MKSKDMTNYKEWRNWNYWKDSEYETVPNTVIENRSNLQYFCLHCGSKISDYTDFQCQNCGWSPLDVDTDRYSLSDEEGRYFCKRCGKEQVFEADNFECSKCYWTPSLQEKRSDIFFNLDNIKRSRKKSEKQELSDFLLNYFKWYELMHYARVAKNLNLLNSWERNFLFNIGKKLQQQTWGYDSEVSNTQKKYFTSIFLDFIFKLPTNYHCVDSPCKKCKKIIQFRNNLKSQDKILFLELINQDKVTNHLSKPMVLKSKERNWEINISLREWQKQCINEWLKNKRGIAKVVTGAGKTLVALEAISRITNKGQNTNVRIFIVVHTIALLEQWLSELTSKLHVDSEDIGLYYGKEWGDFQQDLVQIYTINSARKNLARHNKELRENGFETFLIADECHHYASSTNSRIFCTKYSWTLGLSATPERENDNGFEEILIPNLGDVFFTYSYEDALRDKIISPFSLVYCKIDLSYNEKQKYKDFSYKISRLQKKVEQIYPQLKYDRKNYIKMLNKIRRREENEEKREIIDKLLSMYNSRKMIIHDAKERYNAIFKILNRVHQQIHNPRILIFHEEIKFVNHLQKLLIEKGYNTEVYHSEIPKDKQIRALRNYRIGKSNILITCKALDEGLDVPDTNVGIIAAGTQSLRQRIQRMGRILRKTVGKEHSYIYTIYIPELEDRILHKKEIRKIHSIAHIEFLDLRNVKNKEILVLDETKPTIREVEIAKDLCPVCKKIIEKEEIQCSNCGILIL